SYFLPLCSMGIIFWAERLVIVTNKEIIRKNDLFIAALRFRLILYRNENTKVKRIQCYDPINSKKPKSNCPIRSFKIERLQCRAVSFPRSTRAWPLRQWIHNLL